MRESMRNARWVDRVSHGRRSSSLAAGAVRLKPTSNRLSLEDAHLEAHPSDTNHFLHVDEYGGWLRSKRKPFGECHSGCVD